MNLGWFKRWISGASDEGNGRSDEPSPVKPLSEDRLAEEMRLVQADLVQGRSEAALERIETLGRSNPDDAEVQAHWGICRHLTGDVAGAIEPLMAAVHLDPGNARAYFFLSASLASENHLEDALVAARNALAYAPRTRSYLEHAGNLSGRLGAVEDAARYLNDAWELDHDALGPLYQLEVLAQQTLKDRSVYERNPKIADARRRVINRLLAAYRKKGLDADQLTGLIALLSGTPERFSQAVEIAKVATNFEPMRYDLAQQIFLTFWAAGELELALRFAEACYEREPDRDTYREPMLSAWLASGHEQWISAWRLWTEGLYESKPHVYPQTAPLWGGEPLDGGKILVLQDQGIGDTIIGFRFLPLLAARGVRFDWWVNAPLAELAAQIPGYENMIRVPRIPDPLDYDCAFVVPPFGLIAALHLSREEIRNPPVVRPPADRAPELRARVRALPGVRIGLVYGGNPQRRDDWLRSLPWAFLEMLARIEGVSWVNLMVDDRPDKSRAIERLKMLDLMAEVRDFADTACVVDELDAVVAVDCSVAHLAGNLAKPLWVLAPTICDWRWQVGEDTQPWWPTARLLRSEAPGQWKRAQAEIEPQLRAFVRERSPA